MFLQELDYETHLIGKWDLGYSRWNQTPTNRGFDSFLGYYNNYVSYYDYITTFPVSVKFLEYFFYSFLFCFGEISVECLQIMSGYTGFDLRKNTEPAWKYQGEYATDVFTKQAVSIIKKQDINKPLFLMVSHLAPHAGNEGKLLEAPQETINKFRHIPDGNRRTYAGKFRSFLA